MRGRVFSCKKSELFRLSALAAAVAGGVMSHASAQSLVLEEVVVTATKRQEFLTDVAETVNVVSGDRLQQFNIHSFEDIQSLTPGLTMQQPDPRNQSISLRGVPFDPDSNTSPTVVVYWNGMVVRGNVAFNQLFDIKRIEVLRGPQGSLQGQTSPSGSIQILTQQANPDALEGSVRQTFADNDAGVTDVALSVPLVEGKLGMRLAGVYSDSELFGLKSIGNGRRATSLTRAGRVNFYFTPADTFDASLTYEYLERFTDGLQAVEGFDTLGNGHPTLNAYDRMSLQEGASEIKNRNELVNLTANWAIADHTLTLVSGYQSNLNDANRDLDLGNIFAGASQDQLVNSDFEIWSHELRLANNDPGFWEYLVGLYYFDSSAFTLNRNTNAPTFLYMNGVLAPTLVPSVGAVHTESRVPVDAESYAIFTDHKFYLTDATRLQVGLRWQKNKGFQKVDTFAISVPGFNPGDFLVSSIPKDDQNSEGNAVTGTLRLSHDLNEAWTVYTSYGRSHRGGGATISPTQGVDGSLLVYDEEESDSLEVGFKSSLANGRYQLSGAVYYQKFDDFQNRSGGLFLDLDGNGFLDTPILGGLNYNADAIVQGAELEFNAAITEYWRGYAAVSYNDAKFDGATVPCGALGEPADPGSQARTCQSNGRVGPEPNWSFSASSEYTVPGIVDGMDGFVRALYKFTGSRHDDFSAVNTNLYDGYELGSYGVWDLYLGLRSQDGAWEVSLWSKNLFNKEAKIDLGAPEVNSGRNFIGGAPGVSQILNSGYSTVSVIPERTIGMTAQYRFGVF